MLLFILFFIRFPFVGLDSGEIPFCPVIVLGWGGVGLILGDRHCVYSICEPFGKDLHRLPSTAEELVADLLVGGTHTSGLKSLVTGRTAGETLEVFLKHCVDEDEAPCSLLLRGQARFKRWGV
jgi:hypothetical protein